MTGITAKVGCTTAMMILNSQKMLMIFCIIDADDAADCGIGAVHILHQLLEGEGG